MSRTQKIMLLRIAGTILLLIACHWIPLDGPWRLAMYLIPYLLIGYDILREAGLGLIRGQLLDENFLMSIATLGALALGYLRTGDYTEAVAVMLFYQIGEWFQRLALGKSRRSIQALMDIRPDTARILKDSQWQVTDAASVPIGTLFLLQPGERAPLDGVVEEGHSSLNTSALTGESLPRSISAGDEIYSGSINLTGVLKIRSTRSFEQSAASRILELVENAGARKARAEDFIARFARVYTPIVCLCALLLAVLPPLVRSLLLGLDPAFPDWVYRALSFLVISCPCALVISIPLSFFGGIGSASRMGVLVKGANYLEALSKASIVAFDKTGTLTQGSFTVTKVCALGLSQQALLDYAAHAECASSHPISQSLLKAYGALPDRSRVTDIQELSGMGVIARVDGRQVGAGNDKLMAHLQIPCPNTKEEGAIVHLGIDGRYAGYILVSDTLKPTAPEAIACLRKAGIRKLVLLTGDEESAARETALALQLDAHYSRLLPQEKVEKVEALLQEKQKGETLIFVGDGINDAPVLSRADVGVAMGAMGSEAAMEAADVVLMDDNPLRLAQAILSARKCMAIVGQNIIFAISIKLLCLALGALGLAGMGLAIFADVGVMLLAVLNAMRALSTKVPSAERRRKHA